MTRQMPTLGRRDAVLYATPVYRLMHSEGKERVRSASGVDTAATMIEGAATGLAAQQVTPALP